MERVVVESIFLTASSLVRVSQVAMRAQGFGSEFH